MFLQRYKLRPDRLDWRTVDDEVIVLDLHSSEYLSVNPTGATIWPRLADGATEDELVSALLEAYELDGETARRDVRDFLAALEQRGALDRT